MCPLSISLLKLLQHRSCFLLSSPADFLCGCQRSGIQFRIVFAATIIFFLIYFNTFYGVREVSRELLDAVRIMGANRLQLALRVTFPSALVWVALAAG